MLIIKKGQTMKKTFLLSSICLSLISTGVNATLFNNGPSKQINTTIEKISVKAITADDGVFIDTDSDEFLLERKEWQQIKAYVESALKLPTTEAAMRSLFKIHSDEVEFSRFEAVLDQYKDIKSSARHWDTALYPDIVSLALSLGNYNNIRERFTQPLTDNLNIIINKAFSTDDESQKELEKARQLAIVYLSTLKSFSEQYQNQAAKAHSDLLEYATQMEEQRQQLQVLLDTHGQELENDGSALKEKLTTLNDEITKLNAEYDHYVAVSASAVVYVWAPMFSLPVMGAFGKYAEDVRYKRNRILEEVEVLSQKLSTREKIYASYDASAKSIDQIHTKLNEALPHVNNLKLHWQKINTEFDSLILALKNASGEGSILQSDSFLGAAHTLANTATIESNWSEISRKAKRFAENAYQQVQEGEAL